MTGLEELFDPDRLRPLWTVEAAREAAADAPAAALRPEEEKLPALARALRQKLGPYADTLAPFLDRLGALFERRAKEAPDSAAKTAAEIESQLDAIEDVVEALELAPEAGTTRS